MAIPRSAAVQIVRPPAAIPIVAPAPFVPATGPHTPVSIGEKKRDTTQRICRNIAIYGACRFQDNGCVYYHPPPGAELAAAAGTAVATPAIPAQYLTPVSKDNKPLPAAKELLAEHLSAPVFVPKTPINETVSSRSGTPSAQGGQGWEMTGSLGLMGDTSGASLQPIMTYDDPFGGPNQMDGSMYMPHQAIRPALDYHLYTSPLPAVANPPMDKHHLHSFFIPDDLRRFITARQEATYASTPHVPTVPLPVEVGVYHSLFCLGSASSIPSRVYGHPAPTYRAVSSVDGAVYCLRRIEGYKLVNEAAFGAIEIWRRMKHANIVQLREAFTTKAFNDNSLILVYDFHPNSTTVWDEHLDPNHEPRAPNPSVPPQRRQGMPIPERQLWSYITQIANALKAMHSSGLAARNLDPSKMLITGKNRIRLNGCGILDVLAYDGTTPISVYQQEDLVSFGKLVISLACEFFQPGQHPAAPLDHIARHYSPDVKNLVLFLISKPLPSKGIDDVIRMLGLRILNELDALQSYTDVLESELGGEVENGRLVRLMSKLGFINERAEFELDPRWSDTGDRYILKLFRDYVFHSIGSDGAPILDLSHVLTSLNKLDAGLDERVMLVSRDDQSCLVVSYREIKACVEASYSELRSARVPVQRG